MQEKIVTILRENAESRANQIKARILTILHRLKIEPKTAEDVHAIMDDATAVRNCAEVLISIMMEGLNAPSVIDPQKTPGRKTVNKDTQGSPREPAKKPEKPWDDLKT